MSLYPRTSLVPRLFTVFFCATAFLFGVIHDASASCSGADTCAGKASENLTCLDMMNDINWGLVVGDPNVTPPSSSEKAALCAATAPDPNGWLNALLNFHKLSANKLDMPPLPGGSCSTFRRALQIVPKTDPNHPTDPNYDTRVLEDRNRWATVPRYFYWDEKYWGDHSVRTKRMEFLGTLEAGFTYSRTSCDSQCDPNVTCGQRDAFVTDWIELVRRFDAKTGTEPSNGQCDDSEAILAASPRLSHIVRGHRAFVQDANSPVFDAIANRDVLLAAYRHGTFLSEDDTDITNSNKGVTSSAALFLGGYYFNELNSSSCWRQRAVPRVDAHSRSEFQDDGTPTEGAMGYHVRNVSDLLDAVWIYRKNAPLNPSGSVTFQCTSADCSGSSPCCPPTNVPTKLQKGAEVVALLSQPDHFIATIGDGGNIGGTKSVVCNAARIYQDPNWAFIAVDGSTSDTSCSDPNNPASPTQPLETSKKFATGRILKFRSAWTNPDPNGGAPIFDRNARQLLFYAEYNNDSYHQHVDSLALDLVGYGKHIIVDPGAYRLGETANLDTCWEPKGCYQDLDRFINSENSHSKLVVHGEETCDDGGQSLDDKALGDLFDYGRMSADIGTGFPGTTGKRHVLFVKPDWIFVSDLGEGFGDGGHDLQQNFMLGPTPQDPNHSEARPTQNCNLMRYSSLRELPLPAPCFAVDPNVCGESAVSVVTGTADTLYIDDPGVNLRIYSMSRNIDPNKIEIANEDDPTSSAKPNAVFPVSGTIVRGRKVLIRKANPSGDKAAIHTLLATFPDNAAPNLAVYRQTVKSGGAVQGETTAFGARFAESGKLDRNYLIDLATPPEARKYYQTTDTDSWTFRGRVGYFQVDMSAVTPFSDLRLHAARKLIWRDGLSGTFTAFQSVNGIDLDVEARDGVVRISTDGGSAGEYHVFSPNATTLYENGALKTQNVDWRLCSGKCVIVPYPATCPSSASGC